MITVKESLIEKGAELIHEVAKTREFNETHIQRLKEITLELLKICKKENQDIGIYRTIAKVYKRLYAKKKRHPYIIIKALWEVGQEKEHSLVTIVIEILLSLHFFIERNIKKDYGKYQE